MTTKRIKAKESEDQSKSDSSEVLLGELVEHLRQNRTELRQEWTKRIAEARVLTAMSPEEVFAEATAVYDNYMEVLGSGSVEALQAYVRDLSERIIPRGVETQEVVDIVLLLRDVLARSLRQKYQADSAMLNHVLDAYEPAANRIANTVAVGFVQERERVPISVESDIIAARQAARSLAAGMGFSTAEQTIIATAVSEIARNILEHAKRGEMVLEVVQQDNHGGISIVARDEGPGIADVSLAMQDGYSTKGRVGLGLPGAKRLMDEFNITSEVGKGTTVTMRKWRQ